MTMNTLILKHFKLPVKAGEFGAIRTYDIHTGIDLYCDEDSEVYAFEDGVVVNVPWFTGLLAGSDWWNDTQAILIKGESGVILYGEIKTDKKVGDIIKKGDVLGNVIPVLKTDKGNGTTMLHLELYESDYTGDGVIWTLNESKPDKLLNPNILFNYSLFC